MASTSTSDATPRVEFDAGIFQQLLKTKFVGRSIILLPETATTMVDAATAAKQGQPHGTLILAEFQTQGRGNKDGRTWDSSRAQNVTFTLLVSNKNMPEGQHIRLPLITAIAMVDAARRQGLDAWIKWPNDLWVCHKKVGGMMIRPVDDHPGVHLVGVGINVNEIPEQAERGSIAGFLGHAVSREQVLAAFCNSFERLLASTGATIADRFASHQRLLDRAVTVRPNGVENDEGMYTATVRSFTESGNMNVETVVDGQVELRQLSSQEVTIRPRDLEELQALRSSQSTSDVITGNWKNELGSFMELQASDDNNFRGVYHTAVGNATTGNIVGSWAPASDGGAVLSFSVAWTKPNPGSLCSATAWSGRLFFNRDSGAATLQTLWHLVSDVDVEDAWSAFRTNKDVFNKAS